MDLGYIPFLIPKTQSSFKKGLRIFIKVLINVKYCTLIASQVTQW